VAEVLNKALVEKMELLKKAYREAEEDLDRQEVIEEWKDLDGEDWD
jgi:hypothetical protein